MYGYFHSRRVRVMTRNIAYLGLGTSAVSGYMVGLRNRIYAERLGDAQGCL